ncbi:MAG: L-seryl-tRNA(Sec) selenium transferase [Eubacteriales bacterium]|nr:L-seryl-tRNA(Sec) selenium transferase [Eubacteriales bacterium]
MDKNSLFRNLPSLDSLLRSEECSFLIQRYGLRAVTEALREAISELRKELEAATDLAPYAYLEEGEEAWFEANAERLIRIFKVNEEPILRPVINATGVLLHTNLGRAPLGEMAGERVKKIISSYSNLEYDLTRGRRGERYQAVEPLLCRLTGAEAAMVVNNNASAVLLILNEFARGGEAVVSRGELVEIGGSFRVPEIMELAGCRLHEVGTSNKTHLRDYEQAINENTKLLLKVHKSNFALVGFQAETSLEELKNLAKAQGIPLYFDLGSGILHPEAKSILPAEPSVMEALSTGVDLLSFSGDKLLGGPQAGIILGSKEAIGRLKKNPYTRAFRVDKMCLAALEMLLRAYLDPEKINSEIPIYNYLCTSIEDLAARSDNFIDRLAACGLDGELVESRGEIGGGSAPGQDFPSLAIVIDPANYGISAQEVERRLRALEWPILACIRHDKLYFDLRCIRECEEEVLLRGLLEVFGD